METIDIIGYAAATLTTVSFVPQVVKTWKTKSTEDISLVMFILFIIGLILWLIYGIILNAMPIILANLITCSLAIIITSFKVREVIKKKYKDK